MTWHRLKKRTNAGGVRWHLAGRAVHCGAGLVLRLPSSKRSEWLAERVDQAARDARSDRASAAYRDVAAQLREPSVEVRFEMANGQPVLYLPTGVDAFYDDDNDQRHRGNCPAGRWTEWSGPNLRCVEESGAWRCQLRWPEERR